MNRLLRLRGPYDPYRARKRPRRESPVGSVRRHQVCLTGLWLEDAGFPYD